MAAPERDGDPRTATAGVALRALTAAALALPGLAGSAARADGEPLVTFDTQHYAEGRRDLAGRSYGDLNLHPITVDSLALGVENTFGDRFDFALHYSQDTWSGATPVVTLPQAAIAEQIVSGASSPLTYTADGRHRPVTVDYNTFNGSSYNFTPDRRLVHLMASASPETRRQIDARVGQRWQDTTLEVGGGVSEEPDYHSRFMHVGGSQDFDARRTTFAWSGSYTVSDINASLAANAAADSGAFTNHVRTSDGVSTFFGARRDAAGTLGVTRVIDRDGLASASFGYTRSSGYLGNPYKAVIFAFDDPDQVPDPAGLRTVALRGVLERRPRLRNGFHWDLGYVEHVTRFDAALHVDYRFYHDDWDIDSHTLEVSWHQALGHGWSVVPTGRYYTQGRADFYRPYFLFDEAYPALPGPIFPGHPRPLDFTQIPIDRYSSDERLAAFGSLEGGLAVRRDFGARGHVELGAQYFYHAGSLALGHGEGRYADFDAWTAYASLALDLDGGNPLAGIAGGENGGATGPAVRSHVPAGVDRASWVARGEFAASYRFEYAAQGGELRHGARQVDDQFAIDRGCGGSLCSQVPRDIERQASLLSVQYGLNDWSDLMLRARMLTFDEDLGTPVPHGFAGLNQPPPSVTRNSGGLGDSEADWMVTLLDHGREHVHVTFGLGVPTGDARRRLSGTHEFTAFDAQSGSGTWDFLPSVTYLDGWSRFDWGAQIEGTKRLEHRNGAGYTLGDALGASAWGGIGLTDWLGASVRGLYTNQGAIDGAYKGHLVPRVTDIVQHGTEAVAVYAYDLTPNTVNGPMDMPVSHGGRYWDLGLGLDAVVPGGWLRGNRVSVEWMLPLAEHVNGIQLARSGSLHLSWELPL